jgi:GNAT superfamily N-acetyltransferase
MPEIEIRPAIVSDISNLVGLDHHYASDHVWQMDFNHDWDAGQVTATFRQVRLPRPIRVEYPRPPHALEVDWARRSGILVALLAGQPVGYASLELGRAPHTTWATDLVVDRLLRSQGIGTGLVLAAIEWAASMSCRNLVLEMQPKNYPAIQFAAKLGFEFCGYNDLYYANHEIGIFLCKSW